MTPKNNYSFEEFYKHKSIFFLTISLVIFLIVVFLNKGVDSLQILNKSIQNNYYNTKNILSESRINKDIVVIEIDEKTLKSLGRFPFDRNLYIPFIENLEKEGVAVIGLDIMFPDKTDEKLDKAFAETIKKSGNIVLALGKIKGGLLEKPLDIIAESINFMGFAEPRVDSKNNTVYGFYPLFYNKKEKFEHFSLAILRAYYSYLYNKDYKNITGEYEKDDYFFKENLRIPLVKYTSEEEKYGKKTILINFNNNKLFRKFSFIDIYEKNKLESIKEDFKKKNIDFSFKDKIIIVGTTANGIKDIFTTPNGIENGVYIHANIINTILNKNFLVYFDSNLELFILFLLIILSVYFNFSRYGYVLFLSNLSIITIFLFIYPVLTILYTNSIQNYFLELVLALIISFTISNLLKYIIENKNKNKLNKALSEYVSGDIAKQILSGSGKINLDGESKRISIFFSDIEGFTGISEKFSPEILVSFLRQYLTYMSNIILDKKGFINKYEGDAIMALWGVFGFSEKSSNLACETAILQQKLLKELNIKWEQEGYCSIKARIGIHIGDAIVGNIGSAGRKMEFTALGDNVNLASRLEGVNKFYGTYICVSENVYNETKENFYFRYLDKIRVKGKNNGVIIYELVGFKSDITKEKQDIYSNFEEAIKFYQNKDFIRALKIFNKLDKLGDPPSITYKKRCQKYLLKPPLENWDGTFEMKEK